MILSSAQMVEVEEEAFRSGVQAADLMEVAGRAMADFVAQCHPKPGICRVFGGKGHNGGDVFVAARHLAKRGWVVEIGFQPENFAPLTEEVFESLRSHLGGDAHSRIGQPLVVLDGLLGIGASGAPRGDVAVAVREINRLRTREAAWVVSADLPSGLDADTGEAPGDCVVADATVTMGFCKSGLVADAATPFVGRLAVAELPDLIAPKAADPAALLTPASLAPLLPPRNFDVHKGLCGRVAIVAGSEGYTGAARLCSQATVRGGAGLVTLFVPPAIYPSLAAAAAPEVMVQGLDDVTKVLAGPWNVIAIGPGAGNGRDAALLEIVRSAKCPCVVDADALNAVSRAGTDVLCEAAGPRLLTPHPGEMERLFPQSGRSRREWLSAFLEMVPSTLFLKGSRTLIGQKTAGCFYNTTGHPGMASGGMGDVLTGLCAALIAQGKSPIDAARLGAWLSGRAAEIAVANGASQESLDASDVSAHLGTAFRALRSGSL